MGDLSRLGLVAVPREIRSLCDLLDQEGEEQHGASVLHLGTAGGQPVALAEVPPGPVNAALGTQAPVTHCDAASDELILDYRHLRTCLDDKRPARRRQVDSWSYLLSHPVSWRRVRHLRRRLVLASEQASRLVVDMLLN